MRKDWSALLDAARTLSIPADEYARRINCGEWSAKDVVEKQEAASRIYSAAISDRKTIMAMLEKIERLEKIASVSNDAHWVKQTFDAHFDRIYSVVRGESSVARSVLDAFLHDALEHTHILYPDYENDPEDQIPWGGEDVPDDDTPFVAAPITASLIPVPRPGGNGTGSGPALRVLAKQKCRR